MFKPMDEKIIAFFTHILCLAGPMKIVTLRIVRMCESFTPIFQSNLSNAAFLVLSSLLCITNVTISCDDRRKLNIKHVLKSAPLPTSLQHSAKQYNLKIFHAFFIVICLKFVSFSNCLFFSIFILRNYLLFIFITLLCILTLLYVDKILPYACTLYSHSQKEKNSISIYAFVLILCMFTMYVCCISFVFIE